MSTSHVIPSMDIVLADLQPTSVVDSQTAAPHGRPCEACGAPVEPLDKFCPACGTPHTPAGRPEVPVVDARLVDSRRANLTPTRAEEVRAEPVVETPSTRGRAEPSQDSMLPTSGDQDGDLAAERAAQKYFRCQQCGSEVGMDLDQRSYACPFCDSTYVAEFAPEVTGRQRPEFIIGFAITPEEAQTRFHQWIADNGWFRPGDLALRAVVDKMRGVYLPFWSFSMLAQSAWHADIGEYWYRTETYTTTDANGKRVTRTRQVRETEWWPLAGRHHRYYAGYLVSGSRGLPQAIADRIQPFNLPALRRYEPYFLAGWLCEEYSIAANVALDVCREEFYRREQSHIAAFLPGDTHRALNVQTQFSQVSSDLCLLPVYVLSYHYQGKLFRFLVNGQTGKVTGDKPISWTRVLIAVGIGVAVVAAIGIAIAALSS